LGNIIAGIDFIRRRGGSDAYGLVWPLLTREDGSKFGKTAEGTVWLASDRTSAWRFWQHWMNVPDTEATQLLLWFSSRSSSEIEAASMEAQEHPNDRMQQRQLADEMTAWVHGPDALLAVRRAADVLFGTGPFDVWDASVAEMLSREIPTTTIPNTLDPKMDVKDVLILAGIAASKGAARRLILDGGLTANGRKITDDSILLSEVLIDGSCLLRRGKHTHHLVLVSSAGE
jgi:tyrosyl-tRNA synthetase